MRPVLSREQIRSFDRYAIETRKVPSILLMENAGRGAADVVSRASHQRPGPVVVVAGAGNNGGDGFVVARHLAIAGRSVEVFLAAPVNKLRGDAKTQHEAWRAVDGPVSVLGEDDDLAGLRRALENAGVVVDALFGTGLDRDVSGLFARIIECVNESAARRVALDIPSGLDANTGRILGVAVRAHETATFAHLKLGLLSTVGAELSGRITVVPIGVPASFADAVGQSALLVESPDVRRVLSPRPVSAHKGSAGRVVVVAGSPGKIGAALLVARGALRAGAGLVTIAASAETAEALDSRVLEAMTARFQHDRLDETVGAALEGADAVVIGPGVGLDAQARRLVDRVVLSFDGPKVVDADAVTHFAGRAGELRGAPGHIVLTPHPGEMGRLLGISARDVEEDRWSAVQRAVDVTGAVVLLKGPRTIVGGPKRLPVVNDSGTPALATGGAGDVLSGVLGAFTAVVPPFEASFAAAHLHGLSAERWCRRAGGADRGLLAHEIADGLPGVLASLG